MLNIHWLLNNKSDVKLTLQANNREYTLGMLANTSGRHMTAVDLWPINICM